MNDVLISLAEAKCALGITGNPKSDSLWAMSKDSIRKTLDSCRKINQYKEPIKHGSPCNQVRIFSAYDYKSLEQEINDFCHRYPDCHIISTTMTQRADGDKFTALIVFERN